ncbi:hypothetical protein QQ045_021622 [Rhodiola kirilowii]
MAANNHLERLGDDFFEQILANQSTYVSGNETAAFGGGDGSVGSGSMALQLGTEIGQGNVYRGMGFDMPLGLNLEHGGFFRPAIVGLSNDSLSSSAAQFNETDSVNLPSLYPSYGQLQPHAVASSQPRHPQPFHSQQAGVTSPNQPAVRPRVRARRGKATDPHSIAERLRRERITDRVKALQELVPSVNKTDRATMVDEIVDYVKFLRLQVKVLSMSRLGGTGSGVQHVSDEVDRINKGSWFPFSFGILKSNYHQCAQCCVSDFNIKGASNEGRTSQSAWEKWSADGMEPEVAELMGKDVGEAMQFLQSKGLCVVPISLASSMFQTINSSVLLKSESNAPS